MLSWSRPSRAEDRIESWLVQRHQERVLAGETTPVGPCPDETFLRDLARKAKRIELLDPRVDHAANCSTCMSRLLVFRQENRSRRRKLALVTAVAVCLVIAAVVIASRSLWNTPATSIGEFGRCIRNGKPVGCRYDPRQPARLAAICVFAGCSG